MVVLATRDTSRIDVRSRRMPTLPIIPTFPKRPTLSTQTQSPRIIRLHDLPHQGSGWPVYSSDPILDVSLYLLSLIETQSVEEAEEPVAILPSPHKLAVHLQCTVFDILDALEELSRHGYQYELEAMDVPFLLKRSSACQSYSQKGVNTDAILPGHRQ